ncbi:E3 ubiquitin-protein ligase MARCHF2-like isoform X2 [Hermetia illucens]|uniref:E3 ubiquitin-protein ligase MARCHF2-like isoform X2 n=1 Tax=Hermetia illucens TaxID=343691 RepID=UPI0018CC592A|nr:E3 ubiquitin-protein ligase MARCHF2-like isoform X2 [Hermetia illucens]
MKDGDNYENNIGNGLSTNTHVDASIVGLYEEALFDNCAVHSAENIQSDSSERNETVVRGQNITSTKENELLPKEVVEKALPTSNQSACIHSIPSICCRICQIADDSERLISPCLCSGTIAYVHKKCLERWLNTSGLIHCELCHYRYPVKMQLRYSLWQSLLLWYRHPNNRDALQTDFLLCSLITIVSSGIIGMSLLGLHLLRENQFGISMIWTKGSLIMFLVIVVVAVGTRSETSTDRQEYIAGTTSL